MALDALSIRCLVSELKDELIGARIDKISQPEKDEIVLNLRTFTKSLKLVLSASSNNPRLHLTNVSKKNPITAPMFCMLLRKHLGSGKVMDIKQIGFERIVVIDIESYNELGDLTTKHLIIEIMGKHSNIILTDSDDKIIDSIKHIDFTVSSVREVLPGRQYIMPPLQDKTPFIDFSNDSAIPLSTPDTLDKTLISLFSGVSSIVFREIVYRTFKRCDIFSNSLNTNQAATLKVNILKLVDDILNNKFEPCMVKEISTGKMLDFSAISITQYENIAEVIHFDTMNEVLDAFYSARDMQDRMKQKSADLLKLLNNLIERTAKKLIILERTLNDAKDRDKYKIKGDLITSNLYRIKQGETLVTLDNYYDGGSIDISLDATLSPSQNAQKYYKKYNKAKTAQTEAKKQYDLTIADLEYLNSTLTSLENAENTSDLSAIRNELINEGYINKKSDKKQKKPEASKPLHFVSSDGFDIYVGKNNTQNDYLTLKLANNSDMWFHTKNIHGSHTIIKLGLDKDIPERTIFEAASLAAYYSKARNSANVPVDYTTVKNVKKPNGAKPGMVIYDSYNTVYVTPRLI